MLAKQLADEYRAAQFVNHSVDEITSFCAGWKLAGLGLTEARDWQPAATLTASAPRTGHVMAGVALRSED